MTRAAGYLPQLLRSVCRPFRLQARLEGDAIAADSAPLWPVGALWAGSLLVEDASGLQLLQQRLVGVEPREKLVVDRQPQEHEEQEEAQHEQGTGRTAVVGSIH